MRQPALQMTAQGRRNFFLRMVRRDISDQQGGLAFLAQHDDGVAHKRMQGQCGFNFSQLNTEPPQLDLRVGAAEELDIAVFAEAGEVAGPVQTFAFLIWIGDKALARQLGAIQILARQTGPPI